MSSIPLQGSSPYSEREWATTGVLTSPNFPQEYINDLYQYRRIHVPEGNTIWIRFTDFDVDIGGRFDTVRVSDKDGTTLFYGAENSDDDWRTKIVSNTNTVNVLFTTDGVGTDKGWRLNWGKGRRNKNSLFSTFSQIA